MKKKYEVNSIDNHISLLIIILFVASLGQVSSDLYLPSLPSIAHSLKITTNTAQFTIAIYMLGFSISQLIYGPWSDAVGRRKPLLFGLSVNLIGSLVCYLSNDINFLFFGRFLQGIGVGAGTALARPILRDLFENETLAVYNSYLAISSIVILTTAPILGGYIQQYAGWKYNFLFLALYGALIICFFYFKINETSQHHDINNFKYKTIFKNMSSILKNGIFLKYTISAALSYAALVGWLTAAPILLQDHIGLSPVQFGWLYIFSGLGFAIGGILNMRMVSTWLIDYMMRLGFFCQLSSGLIMLLLFAMGYVNTWVIIIPLLLFMVGSSVVFPNSSAGALSPFPKIAGTAGAVFGFIQILGGALSSSIMALLNDTNQLPIAIGFIIAAFLSLLIFYIVQPHATRPKT